jgi:hypothetical protein
MKFATFITMQAGGQRGAFQQWFAQDVIPGLEGNAPTIRGMVWRDACDSPGTAFDAMNALADPQFSPCEILLETWFSSTEDFRRELLPLHGLVEARGGRAASYHVTPRIQLDGRIAEAGPQGSRPAITAVCAIRWKDGLGRAEASLRYNAHAAIALRCQKTMTRYEQNIVEEVIGWSGGIVPIDAYADFSFRTVDDCRTGLVATHEEMQDTSGYIGAGRFFYLGDARSA